MKPEMTCSLDEIGSAGYDRRFFIAVKDTENGDSNNIAMHFFDPEDYDGSYGRFKVEAASYHEKKLLIGFVKGDGDFTNVHKGLGLNGCKIPSGKLSRSEERGIGSAINSAKMNENTTSDFEPISTPSHKPAKETFPSRKK